MDYAREISDLRRQISQLQQQPVRLARPSPGGGGGTQIIRFVITSVNCETCVAQVDVISNTPGQAISGSEYGYEYESQVQVVDLTGCFLNAPSLDLIGAIGYAARLNHQSYDRCAIGFGTFWEIISLCCQGFSDVNPSE